MLVALFRAAALTSTLARHPTVFRGQYLSSSALRSGDHHLASQPREDHPQLLPEMVELLAHPAAAELQRPGALGRAKLGRRHLPLFAGASVLDRLGRAACEAGVVPRKELFECMAVAQLVHARFPGVARVVDLCSGHGLLSWMLLALADADAEAAAAAAAAVAAATAGREVVSNPAAAAAATVARTAVCVDVRLPDSAEVLERHILAAFPEFAKRW